MAFSYNIANVATSDLDFVRFHIGDTDSDAPIHQDEEINAALELVETKEEAVVLMLENELAALQRQINISVSGINIQQQSRLRSLELLIKEKKGRLIVATATVVQTTRNYSGNEVDVG